MLREIRASCSYWILTWWTTTPLYRARKGLQRIAANTATITAKGQRMIARAANGTHSVSRNGPFLPIKSSNSLFHPLNSIYGLFHIAIEVIKAVSNGMPTMITNKQHGNIDNLAWKQLNLCNFFSQQVCCFISHKLLEEKTHRISNGFSPGGKFSLSSSMYEK